MRVTQDELSIIIPRIVDTSGSNIPDDVIARYVSLETNKECFAEDIRLYFEPTLAELEEEQRMIWESIT